MTSGRMGWAKPQLTWSLAWKDGLPRAPQHPPPQRSEFPLEPELESVSDRLGLGSRRDEEGAVHSGDRAGKVTAKQPEPSPGGSTGSVWGGGLVLTDGGCPAAQR